MKTQRVEDIDPNLKAKLVEQPAGLRWHSAANGKFTMRGLAWWEENDRTYMRLPWRAEGVVRESVWFLQRNPASAHLAFRSDTTEMAVRVLLPDTAGMTHMPFVGSNGLALYEGEFPRIRPWAVAMPDQENPGYERELFKNASRQMREYRLYLPLYKQLLSLDIGLSKGARVLPPTPPALRKPAVFYGTSITQGGCANTAGTDYVSQLGRMLNLDVINMGFSGNGKGEPEVAEFLGEIDAGLFVLDYAANTDAKGMARTLPVFIAKLRAQHPQTPILIVSGVYFSHFARDDGARQGMNRMRDVMMECYLKKRKAGDHHIHFLDGYSLIPFGTDAAFVDGVHPTDHGFWMMAQRMAPVIEDLLLR